MSHHRTNEIRTAFLVLRKTPYSETSSVVAGVTPEHGQLHFVVRGARRLGTKGFPLIDLFRVLEVRCAIGRGEMASWRGAELVTDFGGVARRRSTYEAASWLAGFALANSMEDLEQPRFYEALLVSLQRLCTAAVSATIDRDGVEDTVNAAVVCPCLVFLDEQGLLPDYADNPILGRQRRQLLELGGSAHIEVPPLPGGGWRKLLGWTMALLRHTDCSIPKCPELPLA